MRFKTLFAAAASSKCRLGRHRTVLLPPAVHVSGTIRSRPFSELVRPFCQHHGEQNKK